MKKLQETYFYAPCEEWAAEMEADPRDDGDAGGARQGLSPRCSEEKKQSRNMIDFNDMEQFALRILTVERDGELVPSPVGGRVSGHGLTK